MRIELQPALPQFLALGLGLPEFLCFKVVPYDSDYLLANSAHSSWEFLYYASLRLQYTPAMSTAASVYSCYVFVLMVIAHLCSRRFSTVLMQRLRIQNS